MKRDCRCRKEEARALGVPDRTAAHRDRCRGDADHLGRASPPSGRDRLVGWTGGGRIWARAPGSGLTFTASFPQPALLGGGYLLFIDTLAPHGHLRLKSRLAFSPRSSARHSSSGCSPACSGTGHESRRQGAQHRLQRPRPSGAGSTCRSAAGEVLALLGPKRRRQGPRWP